VIDRPTRDENILEMRRKGLKLCHIAETHGLSIARVAVICRDTTLTKRAKRDEAILQMEEAGAPRKEIADAMRLTPPRICQIVRSAQRSGVSQDSTADLPHQRLPVQCSTGH